MNATDHNVKPVPQMITSGETALGIEFGSTRIKAVLIDRRGVVISSGSHAWENQLVNGLWTYPEEAIWSGLQAAYADLATHVASDYGVALHTTGALGISAMMHGYIALNSAGKLLVPFRTWRNTNTGRAVAELSPALSFSIPHRWSAAHLYQALLDHEPHTTRLARITTLSGLVHERLTGQPILGVGDASGMFPIDPATHDYDDKRIAAFDELTRNLGFHHSIKELLPTVACAGTNAGYLTAAGAALLDPTGNLQPGIPMCPPEGDAGTGMVATNSVAPRTGNVSAGTSIFAMVVLEKALTHVHSELDLVTTPDGSPVAMVHSNNGTSEWDQWIRVFSALLDAAGASLPMPELYDLAYQKALEGAPDGGGLVAFNFLSGEPIVGLDSGHPLFMRSPDSSITLENFLRTQLMTIFGVLREGFDVLVHDEDVTVDKLVAQGGLFKTPVVAQRLMAAALNTPVEVRATAGEGGPWGMALLALYAARHSQEPLADFLTHTIFTDENSTTISPYPEDVAGFNSFMERYRAALPAEKALSD
ncbi:MAG: FGGY-family carbohydrate kinase [Ancrocorticia sp.]|jgi:sugar (pentulose or hexulose) kinase|nr:FGGY-family carbohydrate kinase [Ancrocorticia sp.]MCI1896429.1 FGGY-family carbohydrate kinase [Ancrocorticia sp.]MCI1932622.1 FGGY-family carbohydrate kinase [Ancrocorticia sp.]